MMDTAMGKATAKDEPETEIEAGDDQVDILDEALAEEDELDALRAERDALHDKFMRALADAEKAVPGEQRETDKALIEGIELTMRELVNVFGKHGIEPITPEVGDAFDPQQHQAMFEAPVPGTKQGEIIQVMTVGFMIHDRLLRPAQVGVSSTPAS